MRRNIVKPNFIAQANKILIANKVSFLGVIFIGILFDVLFLSSSSDFRFFILLGMYILAIRVYKLTSKFSLSFCLLLLTIMFLQYLLHPEGSPVAEKAAVWFVLFLGVSIFQQWRE